MKPNKPNPSGLPAGRQALPAIAKSALPAIALLAVPAAAAGVLSINEPAEPADALVSQTTASTYTRSKHGGTTGEKTTRGNSFLMPDAGGGSGIYQVTGLTLRKDAAQSFSAGDALQLWVFEWDPAGDGNDDSVWTQSGTNGTDDGDPLSGTGMTGLLAETYDLEGLSFTDESFLTFDFSDSPLYFAGNKAYGFLLGYVDGDDVAGSYFQYRESTSELYDDGIEIRTSGVPGGNTTYSPRDVVFYVRGSVLDGSADSDNDGLADAWEQLHFKNLDQRSWDDPDDDGVDNGDEESAGTDPNDPDSDGDGLGDAVEIAGPTDPNDADSDDDGLSDGVETDTGTFVSTGDTGTDPMLADSDGDGVSDRMEISRGSDPSDAAHQPGELPNIVFIMIDDLDIREIGVYGQATLQTPRVDTMASQGLLFTDYYTASPVCQSCRSCLMTGQDSRRAQDRHNSSKALADSRVTLAELLQQAGYTTGCVGKWGLGGAASEGAPWNQGFDFFCGYLSQTNAHRFFPKFLWRNDGKIYFNVDQLGEGDSLYIEGAHNLNEKHNLGWDSDLGNVCSHDVVMAEGLQFIEDNADGPFFLYCAWTPPHAYNYPAATLDALTDEDGLIYDPFDLDQTLINETYPGAPFGGTAETPDYDAHAYASMVTAADRDTGRIMDKLVELGIEGNTLVIFCSDNGEAGATFLAEEHLKPGYGDLRDEKRSCYEGGIREPFIAWWPGVIEPGTTTNVVGTFADMLPTFAQMAGVSTPAQVTGRSILPVLLGGTEDDLQPRDYHYWDFTEGTRRWRAVRQGDWKLVRGRANDGSAPTYELFDLAADLYETTDLSAAEPEVLARLIPLVEGSHEVPVSTYFKADDEFFTWSNLTPAAYQTGALDGSGAAHGYSLTPDGTGSCFHYLPFETGLQEPAVFTWTVEFPSGGAASLLLGGTNDAAQCLAVRIDPAARSVVVSHGGTSAASGTFAAADAPGDRAECTMTLDPRSGAGEVVIGATTLPFELAAAPGALFFWGYEVEEQTVYASRPRWRVGSAGGADWRLLDGEGIIDLSYQIPFSIEESLTPQYSFDLEEWHDDPPGLLDSGATNSQGRLQGIWHLPADSLLPRHHDQLFLRAAIDP
ncbi:MAG: sulfatase-like hydrolase/transferase [Verrucomicrobiales bacterium]|nr:sulfatase-like hydrolase/transferase [Verrucomicrobiota bacterium JB025]